jgi:phosphohistidine phosphatase
VALARTQARFDEVLVSPKVRARQTAELASEHWEQDQRALLRIHPALSSDFNAVQARDALAGIGPDGRLLLVGHEPDLSCVLGELTGARVDLKKGGLAIVRLDGAGGELVLLLRPRELALIADVAVSEV